MDLPYPAPTTAAVTAVMKANRKTGSRPEEALRSALHREGLRFRKNLAVRLPDGGLVRPDIVFTRQRVAVFVDGCFWHGCPDHGTVPKVNTGYWGPKLRRNRDRDRTTDEHLLAAGWCVVRLWEHESVDRAARQVVAVVRGRSNDEPFAGTRR